MANRMILVHRTHVFRGAAAPIVVYDISNPDLFAGAKSWMKYLQRRRDQNLPFFASIYSDILHINSTYTIFDSQAGNKADLAACRKISFDEANEH